MLGPGFTSARLVSFDLHMQERTHRHGTVALRAKLHAQLGLRQFERKQDLMEGTVECEYVPCQMLACDHFSIRTSNDIQESVRSVCVARASANSKPRDPPTRFHWHVWAVHELTRLA